MPVPGGSSIGIQPVTMTAADQAILSNPAADAPLEMRNPLVPPDTAASPAPVPGSASDAGQTLSSSADKKDDDDPAKKDKEEKPRSLAAVKVTEVRIGKLKCEALANEMGLNKCVGVCRS